MLVEKVKLVLVLLRLVDLMVVDLVMDIVATMLVQVVVELIYVLEKIHFTLD